MVRLIELPAVSLQAEQVSRSDRQVMQFMNR